MKRLAASIILCILTPSLLFAGGLWNESRQPVTGEVVTYQRAARVGITNEIGKFPVVEFTTHKVSLYPDGRTTTVFDHLTRLNAADHTGQSMPMRHPETGVVIGTFTPETAYVLLYSLFIFAEQKKALQDNGVTSICYATEGPVACQ